MSKGRIKSEYTTTDITILRKYN